MMKFGGNPAIRSLARFTLVFCLFAAFLVGPSFAVDTKLDKINVDKYLQNTQLVEEHMRCLVYSGPCDAIANEMKIKCHITPYSRLFYTYRYSGITTTRCRVCTPEQEQKLGKIAQHWQQHYPLAWRDLTQIISG